MRGVCGGWGQSVAVPAPFLGVLGWCHWCGQTARTDSETFSVEPPDCGYLCGNPHPYARQPRRRELSPQNAPFPPYPALYRGAGLPGVPYPLPPWLSPSRSVGCPSTCPSRPHSTGGENVVTRARAVPLPSRGGAWECVSGVRRGALRGELPALLIPGQARAWCPPWRERSHGGRFSAVLSPIPALRRYVLRAGRLPPTPLAVRRSWGRVCILYGRLWQILRGATGSAYPLG